MTERDSLMDKWKESLCYAVAPYTKTSIERRVALIDALVDLDKYEVVGDVVECGVWKGGSIALARMVSPNRVCWLYDTFDGMTKPGQQDLHRNGQPASKKFGEMRAKGLKWNKSPASEVIETMEKLGVNDELKLRYVEGDVCQTLKSGPLPEQIALLRLDTDWYASTKIELEVLWPLVPTGGVLIVDDYGHWQGARKAVDEYFGGDMISRLEKIDYTAVMLRK
jgi:hypothetical protein